MKLLYEVNESTLYVKGLDKNTCIIKEYEMEKQEIKGSSKKIIDESCINFGATLEGRMKAVGELTGYKYKSPIVISEYQRLIMFPTLSYKEEECAWLALDHIVDVKASFKGVTILFDDNTVEEFNVSRYIILNQLAKAKGLYYNLFNK